jgi:hypothetical protein
MRTGMRLAVAQTALLGLLAMSASVFLTLEQYGTTPHPRATGKRPDTSKLPSSSVSLSSSPASGSSSRKTGRAS